ncbi:P-loop containing nucleoside triphosphate hydrolase protein [Zopfia rhizophila CBS 207.26]|uniref:P-loop containing nucleoside triphosphate hydrolase protein n=1 Tax=Zopfia rhizophila CBS 207.26 TaxID=1314779 RepID=A0A6A6DIL6_9PEZI|nr:P-loop containing nucleoside triphosphate hydrolase protein [Zopfia rhizophila CBS 207.26]
MSAPNRSNNDIRKYYERARAPVAGGTWLGKPEFPSSAELLPGSVTYQTFDQLVDVEEVRPNKVKWRYESNEDYLRTQYNLLREDAVRPLRDAITELRKSPWLNEAQYTGGTSIGLYEPVYITSTVFSPRGLAVRVAFSLGRVKKQVRWDQSKRLITGTLVALSPADDYFQTTCILATVAARTLVALEQNPPEIDLFFTIPEELEIDSMKKWVMVESRSSYFEASRHTLLALQHMMRETFPLSEHLVGAKEEVAAPMYVQQGPFTDLSSLVTIEESAAFQNVNILQEWPSGESQNLDKSQSKALKQILTKRLAIVQGPPGTGKTYVSIVALKILLAKMKRDDPPIIVTCQTNHALDQLLRRVAEFESKFIRLGGRSKDKDKIKKRTLYEVRSSLSQPKSYTSLKTQATKEIRKLTDMMQMTLAPIEANKPPLDYRFLFKFGLITAEQAESLEMGCVEAMGISSDTPGIQMEQWLGKCLTPCPRPILPDDFGFEFEEEDFEVEQLKELEAEAVAQDDDDIEALKGPVTLLSDNQTGKVGVVRTDDEIRDLLKKTQDLYLTSTSDRSAIYNYFQRQVKKIILTQFRQQAKQYEQWVLQRRIGQWEQDFLLLRDQRVIGMTTTGLSKYRALISSLRPQIILVEEAAETLEPPVTAACVPSLEHLILVGDHKQLRPHCQVRDFENEPYNFNLSLFERMVDNDIEYKTLTRQRRMIPEIRRLLKLIYRTSLADHPTVKDINNRPPVEGMGGCNSFFFTHEWLESQDANMSSLNEKEADMIVGFFDYLCYNGVDSNKITVLTFYNGQRKAILKRLRSHPNLNGRAPFNVVTVDSYQGEENDIVLLSLVRSNKRYKIGFLKVDNRVCVALSRAKRGFYIFGNAEMLACESGIWTDVVEIMYGKKAEKPDTGPKRRVGYRLPLECTNHRRKTWIEELSDWQLINGGCEQSCGCRLPCGHKCMLRCHPFDRSRIVCTQKCLKRVELCGHPCTEVCCDPCKCQFCARGKNGTRAIIKPLHKHDMGAPTPVSPLIDYHDGAFQKNIAAPALAQSAAHSEGSFKKWNNYINGGAQVDDAETMRKAKEIDTKFFESVSSSTVSTTPPLLVPTLIQISPVKKPSKSSRNTNLLIDLDDTPPPLQFQWHQRYHYRHAHETAAVEQKNGHAEFGLLD